MSADNKAEEELQRHIMDCLIIARSRPGEGRRDLHELSAIHIDTMNFIQAETTRLQTEADGWKRRAQMWRKQLEEQEGEWIKISVNQIKNGKIELLDELEKEVVEAPVYVNEKWIRKSIEAKRKALKENL